MRDILEQLRDSQPAGTDDGYLLNDATDEIQRLRKELSAAKQDACDARECHGIDAVKLAWWQDLFQGKCKAEVLRLAGEVPNGVAIKEKL